MYYVILACHNRRQKTLTCLRRLDEAFQTACLSYRVVLFDDGSTDGTAHAVRVEFPHTKILRGSGKAFWACAMAKASDRATKYMSAGDTLIWLNDDVALDVDSISRLRDVRGAMDRQAVANACLVGAMRDPQSGEVTYSGFVREGWHPLSFRHQLPDETCRQIHTFNGNFVALPFELIERVGRIDGSFSHALADIDYGLRVRGAGGQVILLPGTFGTCAANPRAARGLRADWRAFRDVKGGGHRRSMRRFVLRHEPAKWPAAYLASIVAWWARRLSGSQ